MAQFQYFAIICILDFLFLVNHFVIRHFRRKLDAETDPEYGSLNKTEVHYTVKKRGGKRTKAGAGTLNPMREKHTPKKKKSSFPKLASKTTWTISRIKAWYFGIVHKEINAEVRFVGWKPLKRKIGLVTTSILLILIVLFLSDEFLDLMGISDTIGNVGVQLCKSDEFEQRLADLNQTLESAEVTNLPVARRQHRLMLDWRETLQDAMSDWGDNVNSCRTKSGASVNCICNGESKFPSWWTGTFTIPAFTLFGINFPEREVTIEGSNLKKNGPYFPGMCEQAREAAVLAAKTRTCTKYTCVCAKIFGTCFGGATQHCFDKPIPCDPTVTDQLTAEDTRHLQNSREAQFDELRKARLQEQDQVQNLVNQITEEDENTAEELFQRILFQVDVAGTAYVLYVCLSLYFPCAMLLFRSGLLAEVKKFVFGAGKYTFIAVVIALWWGAEYFLQLYNSPELALYYSNVLGNPCFADVDFLESRQNLLNQKCEEIMPLEDEFNLAAITSDNIKVQYDDMRRGSSCCGPDRIPDRKIGSSYFGSLSVSEFQELGFTENFFASDERPNGLPFRSTVMRPPVLAPEQVENREYGFLGSSKVCKDYLYQQQVLSPPAAAVDWFGVWISSGLLATFFVKIALANFCIALMYFADPLQKVGGKYIYPPRRFQAGDKIETLIDLKIVKEGTLKAMARRQVYIWGLISNACLFNLALSTFGTPDVENI